MLFRDNETLHRFAHTLLFFGTGRQRLQMAFVAHDSREFQPLLNHRSSQQNRRFRRGDTASLQAKVEINYDAYLGSLIARQASHVVYDRFIINGDQNGSMV